MAQLLVAEESVDATLQRIADLAVRVIDDCDAAGVTLSLDGKYVTAAHTDQRTLAVDQGQYDRGYGPCLQAMVDQAVLRFDVDEAEQLWPDFVADARRNDVRSFLAAPLMLKGESIGALNLYSGKPNGFSALDDVLIAMFTGQASVALANAKMYADAVQLGKQLEEALASRAVIEQAKGVLMARDSVDPDAAFAALKSLSQRRNVKLRTIAQEVVDSTALSPFCSSPVKSPAGLSAHRPEPTASGDPLVAPRASDALLRIDVSGTGDRVVVSLAGELDCATAPQLAASLEQLLDRGTPTRLVIDAAELDFVDVAGLRPLLLLSQRLPSGGLQMRNAKRPIVQVLRLLDLSAELGLDN
jgi:anti-anti-sigma factor